MTKASIYSKHGLGWNAHIVFAQSRWYNWSEPVFCRADQVSLQRGVCVWERNMGLDIWEDNLKKNIDSATSYAKMLFLFHTTLSYQ